jgi:hypothetical protein
MSDEVLRTVELLEERGITAIVRQCKTFVVVPASNGQQETRTVAIPEAASLIVQHIGKADPTVELVKTALVMIGSVAQHYDGIARARNESYEQVEDGIVGAIVYLLHGGLMWRGDEDSLIYELLQIIYRTHDDFSDAFPFSMYECVLAGCSDKLRRAGIDLRFPKRRKGVRQVLLTQIPPSDECQKMQK